MANIALRIILETSPQAVFAAVQNVERLSEWWTKAAVIDTAIIRFAFGANDAHKIDMRVLAEKPDELIQWQCLNGPWADTGAFEFVITPHERGAALNFTHYNWPEQDDFYRHCCTKWGFFLGVSLKNLLESGRGNPHPQDPNI